MKVFVGSLFFALLTFNSFGQHHKNHHTKENHHAVETPLTQTGSDVFDAMQEVIAKLKEDSDTDWSQVDLEGLRQHLLDMKAFTEEVEVVKQNSIKNGVELVVKPQSDRAKKAMKNMLQMHPKMIKKEKGWEMTASETGGNWKISCTTAKEDEIELIRGLGYIGIVVEGAHHQIHHWMMATGKGHH